MNNKFFKLDIKKSTHSLHLGTGVEKDWKLIFIFAAFLSVILITLSVYMFIKIDKGEIFQVQKTTRNTDKILDVDLLRSTVSYYQGKQEEFERIKAERLLSADPSL